MGLGPRHNILRTHGDSVTPKLPNSPIEPTFMIRGAGAGGTGRRAPVFRKVIHKIVELVIDFNDD